jgi:dTDP-4-dehydrorhamnose reductase
VTRWLVTGAGGMLGQDLVLRLRRSGADVIALDRGHLDITDRAATAAALAQARPGVVVNCAGWNAVDDAEAKEDQALAVNGGGPAHLAAACAGLGARLIQPSTDYVFSGTASAPYGEADEPAPQTAYGRTKLAGERAVLAAMPDGGYVLRTAWLFGAHGPSFVTAMVRAEATRDTVAVVDDQHGQPTWTADLAGQIQLLAHSAAPPGIYHASSSGQTTWFGLARAIFELLGADPDRVTPTSTDALARPARRPGYSVLSHARWISAGLPPPPGWQHALRRAFPEIVAAERRRSASPPG